MLWPDLGSLMRTALKTSIFSFIYKLIWIFFNLSAYDTEAYDIFFGFKIGHEFCGRN
jgi:hypothetical protein